MTAPLVRARVVEYLAGHIEPQTRRWNGQVPVNVQTLQMADDLGLSAHDVTETLWHLQKQQIVTFKERKGPKGSTIERIRIADTALKGLEVGKLSQLLATDEEVMNHAVDIVSVSAQIAWEASRPTKNLVDLLTQMPEGIRIRDANIRLGYARLSTAIYSIVKANPGLFVVEKGVIRMAAAPATEAPVEESGIYTFPGTPCKAKKVAPEWCIEHDSMWPRGDHFCAAEWERRNPGEAGAGADAQNDASTTPAEATDEGDLPAILVPPVLADYPAIGHLIHTTANREKVREAARLLDEAGLIQRAVDILDEITEPTALDAEVLRLANMLGWLDA